MWPHHTRGQQTPWRAGLSASSSPAHYCPLWTQLPTEYGAHPCLLAGGELCSPLPRKYHVESKPQTPCHF